MGQCANVIEQVALMFIKSILEIPHYLNKHMIILPAKSYC